MKTSRQPLKSRIALSAALQHQSATKKSQTSTRYDPTSGQANVDTNSLNEELTAATASVSACVSPSPA